MPRLLLWCLLAEPGSRQPCTCETVHTSRRPRSKPSSRGVLGLPATRRHLSLRQLLRYRPASTCQLARPMRATPQARSVQSPLFAHLRPTSSLRARRQASPAIAAPNLFDRPKPCSLVGRRTYTEHTSP